MKSSVFSRLGQRTDTPAISWLMKTALDRPNIISLAAGFTDNESLPVAETRETVRELLSHRKAGQAALQYGTTMGDPKLRQHTSQLLQEQDGVSTDGLYSPERMVITNGSQQLLYLISEAMCDPGDIVLVEDPTYFVFLGIAQSHGLQCRGVKLLEDGIDLGHLEQVLERLKKSGEIRKVKLLYLVTYYQNPSGVTTTFGKKVAALELLRRYEKAAGHPIYLLEDAAYRGLRFAGEEIPSALTVRKYGDRVIYTSTYSKPFATGTRVGYGVMPETILDVVLRIKGNHDFGTSNFLQQLLLRALTSGCYEKHLPALQKRYSRKADTMGAAMKKHLPKEVTWITPQGGLYYWARMPGRILTGTKSKFFKAALANDLLYVPGELCYADDPTRPKPNSEMRLSFGGATETNIRKGIARLGEVMRRALK